MKSELTDLVSDLLALRGRLESKIKELSDEYYELRNKNNKSQKEYDKMSSMQDFCKNLNKRYEDLCARLEQINRIDKQLQQDEPLYKTTINKSNLTPEEEAVKARYEQNYDLLRKYVNDAYGEFKDIIDSDLEFKFEGERKLNKKQIIIGGVSAAALLIVLGVGIKMTSDTINDIKDKNPNKGNDSSMSSTSSSNVEENKSEVVIPELENSTLTKVSSEEEIPARANELLAYLDAVAPGNDYTLEDVTEYLKSVNTFSEENINNNTQEPEVVLPKFSEVTRVDDNEAVIARAGEIEDLYDELAPQYGVDTNYAADMFNYINGGVVEEASREAALDVIRTAEVLMNNEYLYAKDMRNKGESLREENETVIDYGIFFTDGSKGQKLATIISEIRSALIMNPNGENTEKYAKEFTELLMNSWYNEGYGEISASAITPSGQAALIDKLFLNTADLVQSDLSEDYNVTVINPLTGDEITLVEIIAQINQANCPVQMTADNGETFTNYVNKFTYDMEGMLKEAVYNKQAYEENYGKTLTK